MKRKVDELLKHSGAVLIRNKKHQIWRLPNGKIFVRGNTPSDANSDKHSYSDLRNLLGLNDQERGKEGVRRPKKTGGGRDEKISYKRSVNSSLADKLSLNGIVENTLREQIGVLENQHRLLIEELGDLCFFCRVKKWISARF